MDDFDKILLTSSLTTLGAIIVFVASQLLLKLVIEPLQDLKKVLGEVQFALVFHAPAISTPTGNRAAEDLAGDALRRLACDLRSKMEAVPLYATWAKLSRGFLPVFQDVVQASKLLMGLSNNVHGENRSDENGRRVDKIKRLLGFGPWDEAGAETARSPSSSLKGNGLMLSKIANDNDAVKQLFDHFRNVGIAALVASSSRLAFSRLDETNGVMFYVTLLQGTFMLALGLGLFGINFIHGERLLRVRVPWLSVRGLAYNIVYVWFVFTLFSMLASSR